jgi:hypothetical protein
MKIRRNEIQQLIRISKQPEGEPLTGNKRSAQWIALALCAMVLVAGVVRQLISNLPDYASNFAPVWIPFIAAVIAAAGIIRLNGNQRLLRIQGVMRWIGLLFMVWTANGLPFDLLRLSPLMPPGIDWPGMVTRTLALAAAIMLGRIILAQRITKVSTNTTNWYGYAAFVLALPYPVLRICWAFGAMIGITIPGAAGSGFSPLLFAIPWMLAAVLSLFLVSKPGWMSRRLLLIAGWTATAIVAMIGPAAFWFLVTQSITGTARLPEGMKFWIPCLFYSSWFLWAIAAGAATRSYQLRSAA